MSVAIYVPLAMKSGGRLAIVPAPLIEFMRDIAGGVVYDDRSISRQQIVRILRNAKGDGKAKIFVRAGVGNREKRIRRRTLVDVDAPAVVGVDIAETALQKADRTG